MVKFIKQNLLPISVFITGACILIIEVVAVRILSIHFGNTIFTVSSVISVILAALSVGYYTGGKFADRYPSLRLFFIIILSSGLVLLAFHLFGILILPILSIGLPLSTGPLLSSMLLFLFPALLLGTLSPYAVKLQSIQSPGQGIGTISGKIFFWSTVGSIIGSLLAGFVLIPNFGINSIMIATGIVLFFLGFIPLSIFGVKKKHLFRSLLVATFLIIVALFAVQQIRGDVVYSKDGVYEKITIHDGILDGRPTRFFQQDRSISGAMFLDSDDPTDMVYEYTKYYSLYKIFKPDVQNALVIGGGAYSIPKALLAELPDSIIDVSEIEPELFSLAKKYFNVKNDPRLHSYTEDGRRLLRDSDKRYDLIFGDVYYSLFSIPAHFTTQDFFTIAKESLTDDGIFIINLIGDLSRQQPSLIMSEIKTFKSVFPNSYFFAIQSPRKINSQNIIFVGYNSDKTIDLNSDVFIQSEDPIISSLKNKEIDVRRFDLSPYPILTDDFSPVEYLTAKILRRVIETRPLIDGEEMLAIINQQLRYGPRYLGAVGHNRIQNFLIAEMGEQAEEVITQQWDYTGINGESYNLINIIGRLYPLQERRIILATHYDSKKFADMSIINKDQPVPGANDSASGVAILIELARALNNSNVTPNIGIDIIFFDGEEGDMKEGEGYSNWKPLGSTHFAENINDLYGDNKPISALVLDMVCDKDLKIYKEHSSVLNASTQMEVFWNIAKKVDDQVFQDQVTQVIQDDHTLLNQAGIPSFLLIDFEYPYYHTTGDTADKCSAKSLETVARAIFDYIYVVQ